MKNAAALRQLDPEASVTDLSPTQGPSPGESPPGAGPRPPTPASPPETVFRADYQPAALPVAPAEDLVALLRRPGGRRAAVGLGLGLLTAFILGAGVGLWLPGGPPRKSVRPRAALLASRGELAATLPAGCLREASQIIHSDERDTLLLDATKAYDSGQPERTLELLRKYVAEACDRATLEAVEQLERKLPAQAPPTDPGPPKVQTAAKDQKGTR